MLFCCSGFRWKEGDYTGRMFDRVQTTNMHFSYNEHHDTFFQKATLFGAWPKGQGTEFSNRGFIFNQNETDWKTTCEEIIVNGVSIGQEPPWWPTLGLSGIFSLKKELKISAQNGILTSRCINRLILVTLQFQFFAIF